MLFNQIETFQAKMEGKKKLSAFQMKQISSAVADAENTKLDSSKKRKSRSKSRDTDDSRQVNDRERDDITSGSPKKTKKKEKKIVKEVITVNSSGSDSGDVEIIENTEGNKKQSDGDSRSDKKKRRSRDTETRERNDGPKESNEQDQEMVDKDSKCGWSEFSGEATFIGNDNTKARKSKEKKIVDYSESTLAESPFVSKISGGVIVALKHPSSYIMKGKGRIRVLVGSVSLLGYNMTPQSSWQDVFSPDCSSLLTLVTTSGSSDIDQTMNEVVDNCRSFKQSKQLCAALKTCSEFCVFEFRALPSPSCDFIASFPVYSSLLKPFNDSSHLNQALSPLGLSLVQECRNAAVEISLELQESLDQVITDMTEGKTGSPVIMMCGGKSSGKSTTTRILVNSLLNKVDCVYYLDCDVGQTEFTPSGVVSLLALSKPVFGQPFCHQRKPLWGYMYGGLSPRDSPSWYLRCLQSCVEKFESLGVQGPLVVNTMGWLKDLGYQLLVDTARLVHPTHILQLFSEQRSANIPPLSEEFYMDTSWTDVSTAEHKRFKPRYLRQKFELFQIPPAVSLDCYIGNRLKASDHRNLCLLSHLGNDLHPGLTLVTKEPYYVPWKEIAVHVSFSRAPKSQVMYALNASVVALCSSDVSKGERETDDGPVMFDRLPTCTWLGYGIIRAIDQVEKVLYVTTSLPLNVMASVNTLVKTAITFPDELLLSQNMDKVPYVSEKIDSAAASSLKPRRNMPRRGGTQNSGANHS